MNYWIIRHNKDAEPIGVFSDKLHTVIKKNVIYSLDKAIGHYRWWLDTISKAEYETYKEFGFKEYRIG